MNTSIALAPLLKAIFELKEEGLNNEQIIKVVEKILNWEEIKSIEGEK